jgi:hypothetical protein
MWFLPVVVLEWLFNGIGNFVGRVDEAKEREYYKQRSYDPETETYTDQYGTTRFIKDNSYVRISRNVYGETEVKYANGIVRNLKQEENDKKSGSVTKLTGYSSNDHAVYMREAIGSRYKDRKNGKIYVIRSLEYNNNWFNFFVDINDGSIVRPTDGQYELERRAKENGKVYYTDQDFLIMKKYFDDHRCFNFPEQLFRNKNNSTDYEESSISYILRIRKEIQ